MRSVLSAGQRGHEVVVVDLPRHLDPAAEEAVVRSAVTLLVVPAEVRAVAAASRVPAWAQMRADKGVGRALDEGLGPLRRRRGPLATCCLGVLERLATRPAAA
jgi:hypothetical protein